MSQPKYGGNNFTLFTVDTQSGVVKAATRLHPTPDDQGPAGLVFEPTSGA